MFVCYCIYGVMVGLVCYLVSYPYIYTLFLLVVVPNATITELFLSTCFWLYELDRELVGRC